MKKRKMSPGRVAHHEIISGEIFFEDSLCMGSDRMIFPVDWSPLEFYPDNKNK